MRQGAHTVTITIREATRPRVHNHYTLIFCVSSHSVSLLPQGPRNPIGRKAGRISVRHSIRALNFLMLHLVQLVTLVLATVSKLKAACGGRCPARSCSGLCASPSDLSACVLVPGTVTCGPAVYSTWYCYRLVWRVGCTARQCAQFQRTAVSRDLRSEYM